MSRKFSGRAAGSRMSKQLLSRNAPFILLQRRSPDGHRSRAVDRRAFPRGKRRDPRRCATRSMAADVAFEDGRVVDIANRYGREGRYDFAGIAVWQPAIFDRIPPGQSVSLHSHSGGMDWAGRQDRRRRLQDGKWFNIGSRTEYLEVHRIIQEENWKPAYVQRVRVAGGASPPTRSSIPARVSPAFIRSAPVARSARTRSWKTQFFGRAHKSLPDLTSATVLSAPIEKPKANISDIDI